MSGLYDYTGKMIDIEIPTDTTMKLPGVAADAKTVGDLFDAIDTPSIEPLKNDIPEVYITGTPPTSKEDGKIKVGIEYISQTSRFSEYATLKVQGNSSTNFPKKNFNIAFFSDADCTVKSKHNFKGWGQQNKFTLKANWIDITQARNVVSARLWADVVKSRSNYSSLPDGLKNAPNLAAIDGFIVKVYVNGIYQGRYTFNMPKDKWMFNMDDSLESNVALYSEDFVDACRYKAPAVVDGTDWTDEIHEDAVPQSVVTKLNTFISFLMTSSDADFVSNLSTYADVISCIDFWLFIQVINGTDSYTKNQMLLSYDNSPYILSAYDLDCTYGLNWEGNTIGSPTGLIGSNSNLYTRLSSLMTSQINARYAELRAGALSTANIIHRFEDFLRTQSKELVEEDYASTTADGAFTEIPSKNITSLQQIRNFVAAKLDYLDGRFLT